MSGESGRGGGNSGKSSKNKSSLFSGKSSKKGKEPTTSCSSSNVSYYGMSLAPSTGQLRSGHMEVDTLYGTGTPGLDASTMVVNAMNAPNNSTLQCGCENIDCPFCNLMLSVQMKEPS